MSLNLLPPTYEEQRTQLLISPCPGAVQFQKGFLGAHGERAAIEGELQIKGAEPGQWDKVAISLQTIESNFTSSIEISSCEVILFSRTGSSTSSSVAGSDTIPSTLPFAIPLMPDTPQCIHTPRSSITHQLVARLSPINPANQVLTETIMVHTRRYTTYFRPLLCTRPHLLERDDPVMLRFELPRTTFRIGEPIPVYITIPPPDVSVIRDRGLQLRSVRAELIRVISLGQNHQETFHILPDDTESCSVYSDVGNNVNSDDQRPAQDTTLSDTSRAVITRSGSSCRFHSSRAVQIRLLLYPHETALHDNSDSTLANAEQLNDNSDCASITQSTLFHDVSFRIDVNVTFMAIASHSETVSSTSIPIILLPNIAPFPEVDESFGSAYRKKHDKPPVRTVRHQDADIYENEAGPSVSAPGGAPPPFEERDAPPPFFSDPTPSTSSRLPTFLESEADFGAHIDLFPNSVDAPPSDLPPHQISIPGEGTEFGFKPEDQYDGLSLSFDRSTTPPPSMDNANSDPDVTEFASLASQPDLALEAIGRVLEQPGSRMGTIQPSEHDQGLPPPPPLLDDPSDPPPSIDVEEFRRPSLHDQSRDCSPASRTLPPDISVSNNVTNNISNPNAPPPYLQPQVASEPEEIVTRPPPYVDVMPTGAGQHV